MDRPHNQRGVDIGGGTGDALRSMEMVFLRKHFAIFVFCSLTAFTAGGVFAQEKTANVERSWLSLEPSVVGSGWRYEFMINEKLSLGLNCYATFSGLLFNDGDFNDGDMNFGANVVGRFYPWGKTFYAGLGSGWGYHDGREDFIKDGNTFSNKFVTRTGYDIVPELGWKIDVGKPGGFFLNPLVQVQLTLGTPKITTSIGDIEGDFGMNVGFRAAFGIGGSF
jgi:hypothetical protein